MGQKELILGDRATVKTCDLLTPIFLADRVLLAKKAIANCCFHDRCL